MTNAMSFIFIRMISIFFFTLYDFLNKWDSSKETVNLKINNENKT